MEVRQRFLKMRKEFLGGKAGFMKVRKEFFGVKGKVSGDKDKVKLCS